MALLCELCSASWVKGMQSLCCCSHCRQYSLSAERKTMAHPNNLDRCRMKYLMRNIVSGRTWVGGTCDPCSWGCF